MHYDMIEDEIFSLTSFSAEQAAEEGDEVSIVTSLPQVMEKYCEALTAVVSAMVGGSQRVQMLYMFPRNYGGNIGWLLY